jgi:hypothetical protein
VMSSDPTDQFKVMNIEDEPKRHHSVQATRLIHEHYGTIMAYAYSRTPLSQLVRDRFEGEWKYLHRAIFELPEERAGRALVELALYVRLVDDDEERAISKLRDGQTSGEVVRTDDSRETLAYREVSNKIIHAERYEWNLAADSEPTVTCIAGKDEGARHKWTSATISLIALGALCGSLMS